MHDMAKLDKAQQIEVNVAYFRQNLQQLLKEVEKGKTIRISRYQKTVAIVSPPASHDDPRPKFGTGKGRVRIIDPHWAEPMTDNEVDAFLEGRY